MNILNMETKYIDTPEWDKTFALSDKVSHKKVSFTNRYGIRLVGDLYMPKNHAGKLPVTASVWSATCTCLRTMQGNCPQSLSAVLMGR